ncbi:signal peptidase II [Blastococcus sp. DSM 46792]|uniref:Lipoprotein signal peptidase n=1 Tax=Blastococcus goldschmidtiae TaxID=3075546 RepID=A0ABU2K7G2_9ACTN|nr:signal peptidase II [Blastococcus sp. DSM 46792]MDT0276108.1 signal peptidase II [Blastococcus sp. DSM 46792]
MAAAAAGVAAVDLTAKAWAQSHLSATGMELGPVDLRLGYNPGVAFSLGADAPAWLIIAVTATITAAVAVFAWLTASRGSRGQLAALALILGGAVANLADRAADGVVTDYLHTGWWPTFNLADTAIVTGGLLFALTTWRSDEGESRTAARRGAEGSAVESGPASAPPPSPRGSTLSGE